MSLHVIVGAGPVGSATAQLLADAGHQVRLVTRSGSGPDHAGIERVRADATDVEELVRLATGAEVLYNCANPEYHRWLTDWPPLAAAFLAAAERTGAVLVAMSNLYGYGPVDHPMVESDPFLATTVKGPVRARMWEDMAAAHAAGRIRATEARASDFYGPGVTGSHLGDQMVPPVLKGKTARVIGNPDTRHSWTYVPDVARTLVAIGADEAAWGRAWHVPTNPAATQRSMLEAIAAAAGAPSPTIKPLPMWFLKAAGLASPQIKGLVEMAYQFEADFVLDSSAATAAFGIEPTPLDEAIATTAAWWTAHLRAAA